MIRLQMSDYNMSLTEKQQKNQPYHQVKLINMRSYMSKNIAP